MTVEELIVIITDAQNKIFNIEVPEPTLTGSPDENGNASLDLTASKNKLAVEMAKILSPVIFNFVEAKALEIATKISTDSISSLIGRIRTLEIQLGI